MQTTPASSQAQAPPPIPEETWGQERPGASPERPSDLISGPHPTLPAAALQLSPELFLCDFKIKHIGEERRPCAALVSESAQTQRADGSKAQEAGRPGV